MQASQPASKTLHCATEASPIMTLEFMLGEGGFAHFNEAFRIVFVHTVGKPMFINMEKF